MVTRAIDAWNSEASFWMAGGHVAENMSVWRSARVAPAMARMCGSKPRSSIRSASSSTRYVTPDRLRSEDIFNFLRMRNVSEYIEQCLCDCSHSYRQTSSNSRPLQVWQQLSRDW